MTSSATLPESLEIPDATKLPLLTGDCSTSRCISACRSRSCSRSSSAIVLERTTFGLRLRAIGLNRAGGQPRRHADRAYGDGGRACHRRRASAAWPARFMLQGEQYVLKDGFSSGYGFDGLVVGLLARGSVTGVIAAALLFGFLRSGGINMEMVAGVPTALVAGDPGPDRHRRWRAPRVWSTAEGGRA